MRVIVPILVLFVRLREIHVGRVSVGSDVPVSVRDGVVGGFWGVIGGLGVERGGPGERGVIGSVRGIQGAVIAGGW